MNIATDAAARKPSFEEIMRVTEHLRSLNIIFSFAGSSGMQAFPMEWAAEAANWQELDARLHEMSVEDHDAYCRQTYEAKCPSCGAYVGENVTPQQWISNGKKIHQCSRCKKGGC